MDFVCAKPTDIQMKNEKSVMKSNDKFYAKPINNNEDNKKINNFN